MQFVKATQEIMDKALAVLEIKLNEAIQDEKARGSIPINQLTSAINTLYDKKAHAIADNEQSGEITIMLNGELSKWAK